MSPCAWLRAAAECLLTGGGSPSSERTAVSGEPAVDDGIFAGGGAALNTCDGVPARDWPCPLGWGTTAAPGKFVLSSAD